ncbi:MAG TPA: 4'-phosphopantetheinyl transferase superfamily protein [Casimicrobiaceae bacterium]|jgi:KDO2-lipid IV(A) lauroyltransferase|nr:4'-phosphopantetheinyl transferase superfamily protein [Casimicrobiaceae bacterium]
MAGSADPFLAQRGQPTRCGIDSVEIARIERLLRETPAEDLIRYFSPQELTDSGDGPGRAASLAARFAAKEACAKLFPRELALAEIEPADFSIERDAYGAPQVVCSARAGVVLGRQRLRAIAVSLTHDRISASAVALALPAQADAPLAGRLIYRLFPLRRRVILENLHRVFGAAVPEAEIIGLAQAHYAHLWRLAGEFVRFRWLSEQKKSALIRVDNVEALARALERGKGALILTGHFGNFEVATIAGLRHFPHMRGRFHFIRRAIRPRWLDALVNRRFRQGGFGVVGKRGSLDVILERLEAGDLVVFPFDQHASPPDGIAVDFFGHPAGTFKSLAIMALATGAPVVPASSWREPDGSHVLRFEEALPLIECVKVNEEIRRNTRAYNAMLEILVLRHPEQWFWVHRRWKLGPAAGRREGQAAQAL